jgi:hypothetical protein
MNERTLTAEYCGRTYEHGTVEVTREQQVEWDVEADIHLVVSSEDYNQFCDEIEAVIRKYAL